MSQFHKSTHCLLTPLFNIVTSPSNIHTSLAMLPSDVWMLISDVTMLKSGVIDVTMSRLTSHVLESVTNDSTKVLYFTNQQLGCQISDKW